MNMDDRRKYKREIISPHLKVVIPDTDQSFGAFVTNISSGGIEVYADQKLEPKQEVQLHLSFETDPKSGQNEVVTGEIRWVKISGPRFLIGISFKNVNSTDHPILSEFLDFVGN